MKAEVRFALIASAVPLLLAAGWFAGKHSTLKSQETGTPERAPAAVVNAGASFDSLLTGQSSRSAAKASTSPSTESPEAVRLRQMDSFLRKVPFSVLKQAYLERQDEEFLRLNSRYSSASEGAEVISTADLYQRYLANGSSMAYYVANGDFALRGRTLEYRALFRFYSSRDRAGSFVLGDATEAKAANEVCWSLALYLKVGERYVNEGSSSCLDGTSQRSLRPFGVIQNYAKDLAPYFDSIGIPIPGFGTDSDVPAEWYDSVSSKWSALSRVRWEASTEDEYRRLRDDLGTFVLEEGKR